MLSQCYSLYRIAVDASLPKPSPIFRPDWYGGLAGFRRALKGVSNSGVFIGILLRQSLWRYVERDWQIGKVSVTYVALVPWRREWKRNVLLPRLLYHCCTAGAHSLGSSVKNWCAFARALLLYRRCRAKHGWNTNANCHWLVLLTLKGDWALERDPTTSVTLTLRLCSLLQGMRVTYVAETFSLVFLSCLVLMWWVMNSFEKNSSREHRWKCQGKIRKVLD